MGYKIIVTSEVIKTLDKIDDYCISHFGNYEFSNKVLNEIIIAKRNIEKNYKQYKVYHKNIRKVVMPRIRYNLYFYVDEKNKVIRIYSLKSFKERQ